MFRPAGMMGGGPIESALKRERLLVGTGLALIAALAWAYIAYLAWAGTGSGTGAMGDMAGPLMRPWGLWDFWIMFVMWAVMMVAMMVPSAAPMVLIFATINRQRREKGDAFVSTGIFLAGYLIVWGAFSIAAVAAQYGLQRAALVSPMMAASAPWLGAALLFAAGVYQLLPFKDACLAKCRTPFAFIMTEWRDGSRGALVMGLHHGAYCTGCCWALMGLLFFGGVMNLLWVAAIAGFVLAEKVVPHGDWLAKFTGAALLAWGCWVAAGALLQSGA